VEPVPTGALGALGLGGDCRVRVGWPNRGLDVEVGAGVALCDGGGVLVTP